MMACWVLGHGVLSIYSLESFNQNCTGVSLPSFSGIVVNVLSQMKFIKEIVPKNQTLYMLVYVLNYHA